jgi:hypothetical protein
MTESVLQMQFCEELTELFKNERLFNPDGELSPVHVFAQRPEEVFYTENADGSVSLVPFVNVFVAESSYKTRTYDGQPDTRKTCCLMLAFATYDNDNQTNGHLSAMHLKEMVELKLRKNPKIGDYFLCDVQTIASNQENQAYHPFYLSYMGLEIWMPDVQPTSRFI